MIQGHVHALTYDRKTGLYGPVHAVHNLIVATSKPFFADLFREAQASSPIRAIAIGSGSTAPDNADTQLEAEITRLAIPVAGTDTTNQKNIQVANLVTIRQLFLADIGATVNEYGLFGDIAELTPPSAAPTLQAFTSGGSLADATYSVTFTWANANGETTPSPADTVVVSGGGGSGMITVTVPALPDGATEARIYASISGPELLGGTTSTTTFDITVLPSGVQAPGSNTTLRPGIANSGRLFNRALIGPISPSPTQDVYVEAQINFG